MKSFIRTSSGLKNQHIFFNVDLVLILEGGSSHSKYDVELGKFNENTLDIAFWQKIFSEFKPTLKIKLKSVGSKFTVLDIAKEIVDNNLQNIIVAMDNEFDEVYKKQISHPSIFYTYGYSFENDIWSNPMIIKDIIDEVSANNSNFNEIEKNYNDFIRLINIAVLADCYLFKSSKSFFPRPHGYLFCIEMNQNKLPKVISNNINHKLSAKGLKKNSLYYFKKKYSIIIHKHCYGHLIADYCFQIIQRYLKIKYNISGLQKHIAYRICIIKYFEKYFRSSNIYNYYQAQFN